MSIPAIFGVICPALNHLFLPSTTRTRIDPTVDRGTSVGRNFANRPNRPSKPECRLASTREEWEAALGLVYEAYLRTGLIEENRHRMRVTPYHALPTTELLIAADQNNEVLCSLSIVGDGELGLPMEAIYPAEVEARRRQGIRVAEVSCLAKKCGEEEQSFSITARLMALTAQCAAYRLMDELLVVVHPHHVKFYERFLAFETIGELKTYASVCDNPAVALSLDLNRLSSDHPRVHKRLFGTPFPVEALEPRPISLELQNDLGLIAAETFVDGAPVFAYN